MISLENNQFRYFAVGVCNDHVPLADSIHSECLFCVNKIIVDN